MFQIKLKELREKYEFTYTQLEKMFGLGRGSYVNLEKSKDPKLSPRLLLKIVRIYNALGESLTVEELIEEGEDDIIEIRNESEFQDDVNQKSETEIPETSNDEILIKTLDDTLIEMLTTRLKNNKSELINRIKI